MQHLHTMQNTTWKAMLTFPHRNTSEHGCVQLGCGQAVNPEGEAGMDADAASHGAATCEEAETSKKATKRGTHPLSAEDKMFNSLAVELDDAHALEVEILMAGHTRDGTILQAHSEICSKVPQKQATEPGWVTGSCT